MSVRRTRKPRPVLAMAITLPVLAGLGAVAAATADDRLGTPLFVALCICAVCATLFRVELSETVFFDASLVPAMLATALIGPAGAGAIALIAEVSTWLSQRHRIRAALINLASIAAPAVVWALLISKGAGYPGSAVWYVLLVIYPAFCTLVNVVGVSYGLLLCDGRFDFNTRWTLREVLPAIAINAVLGVATGAIYIASGLAALVFVLASLAVFAYLAAQASVARERARDLERLATNQAKLAEEIGAVEDAERLRLADALHDQAIQNLLAVRQDLHSAMDDRAQRDLAAAVAAVDATVEQLRSAIFELRPPSLDELGLVSAVERLAVEQAARGNFEVSVSTTISETLSRGEEELLFSLARELVINVARHSSARAARLRLSASGGVALIEVADDGSGFSLEELAAATDNGHFGLRSCTERVRSLDGTLEVKSVPFGGTSVRATFPLGSAIAGPARKAARPRPSSATKVFAS